MYRSLVYDLMCLDCDKSEAEITVGANSYPEITERSVFFQSIFFHDCLIICFIHVNVWTFSILVNGDKLPQVKTKAFVVCTVLESESIAGM